MANARKEVFLTLKEDLQAQIESGEFAPGAALPSESRLCNKYGISRPSVRKALAELENNGLIYRKPGKGSFVSLSENEQNKIFNIGVDVDFSHYLAEWYYAKILKGVSNICSRGNARMVFVDPREINNFSTDYYDALVSMVGAEFYDIDMIAAKGIPTVAINRLSENPEVAYIAVDYAREACKAVKHLIAMGHTKIGILVGDNGFPSEQRLKGYENALVESGIVPDASTYFYNDASKNIQEQLEDYLEKNDFTAVFAVNATYLFPFYNVCIAKEINIPDDISVICFDDVESFSKQVGLKFSEVKMPLEDMGELAACYLIDKLKYSSRTPVIRHISSADILLRESCKIIT